MAVPVAMQPLAAVAASLQLPRAGCTAHCQNIHHVLHALHAAYRVWKYAAVTATTATATALPPQAQAVGPFCRLTSSCPALSEYQSPSHEYLLTIPP
jgi:hypothetical protein